MRHFYDEYRLTKMMLNIYVTTYNRAEYLTQTIDSILNQSFKDFTLYVLDNCSSDNTKETIEGITDSRLRYIRHEKNIGGIGNINFALNHCDTDYLVIFHDDDIMLPCFLQKQIQVLEHNNNIMAVGGNTEQFGAIVNPILFDLKEKEMICFQGSQYISRYLRNGDTLVFPSVMYRNSFLKKEKIYLKSEPGPCADVVLLADIERKGGVICQLRDVTMKYRIHQGQDSSKNYFSMHIDLFNYLKNSEEYKEIYESERAFYPSKYNNFCRLLFRRVLDGDIDRRDAKDIQNSLKKALMIERDVFWEGFFEMCIRYQSIIHLAHAARKTRSMCRRIMQKH